MAVIEEQALVVAAAEIEIEADPDTVWALLADIESWPSWNPDVRSASLAGELVEGTTFRWETGPGTITSTVRYVEAPRVLAWTGRTLGLEAVHVYRLERDYETTRVRTEESWIGIPARLFQRRLTEALTSSLELGLQRLKLAAEGRVR